MRSLVLISLCGALLAGCGGGEDEASRSEEYRPTLQLSDACPQIQDALDASFEGSGLSSTGEEYQQFTDAVGDLTEQISQGDRPLLESLTDASQTAADGIDEDPAGAQTEWFEVMKEVTESCRNLGVPLR